MINIDELRSAVEAAGLSAISREEVLELLDRLEAAEKECESLRQGIAFRDDVVAALAVERDALRARIEAMEKQEPVKHEFQGRDGVWYPFIDQRHHENTVADGSWPVRALYALPGAQAQPAPSEQDEFVRKAWARFSNELHRSPNAPYPGMSEAFEQHFSQSFTDRDWRVESGVWAAAWKAAKRHGAQPAPSVSTEVITDYLVSISAHLAHQDDRKAQAEIGELLKMLAAAPEAKP